MWNNRFSQPGYLFGTEPAQFMCNHASYFTKGVSALAVADGEGRNSTFMAGCGVNVTAMDSSDVAVEKARALAQAQGVEVDFHVGDISRWAWQAQRYDLVVGVFIQFAGPEMRAEMFHGMRQALKPGGHILLHGYSPKQLEYGTGGPGRLENLYTEDMLRKSFDEYEIVELISYDREINEGAGHSGLSALVDLVARKPLE